MVSLVDIHISRDPDETGRERDTGADGDAFAIAPLLSGSLDERRMQVRAYRHWLSQVTEDELPAIEDLDPEALGDIGRCGVLIDLTLGLDRPAIIYLGETLAAECGDDRDIFNLGDVPERSLLSRLTEYCLEVVANRTPIGFDAEFDDNDDRLVLYRSILLPYSSDGTSVNFVFGVISWKHGDKPAAREALTPIIPVGGRKLLADEAPVPNTAPPTEALFALLASARDLAALASALEFRSHQALYRAVSRLHDCAIAARRTPGGLASLLELAGVSLEGREPLVSLVRAAFGEDWPKSRVSELALVLRHADIAGLGIAALEPFLLTSPGGIKGVVRAMRNARRGDCANTLRPTLAAKLRKLAPVEDYSPANEFAVLVARRNHDGTFALLGEITDQRLFEQASQRLLKAQTAA